MALEQWGLVDDAKHLPLDQETLDEIVTYAIQLPEDQAAEHLRGVLGDSPEALDFIIAFNTKRPAPSKVTMSKQQNDVDLKSPMDSKDSKKGVPEKQPPPPYQSGYAQNSSAARHRPHTNAVIEAGRVRARDEQEMQNLLQTVQYQYGIYN